MLLILPADWVGAMSWPALDGRISTGAGGEVLTKTSTRWRKHKATDINSIKYTLKYFNKWYTDY